MRLIKPFYQILSKINGNAILGNIERAGRICYKSEENITSESAKKFIKMIIERGHESVLEHEKITVLFVCDRGVSHELVRHRLASFSQESTRYCNYTKDKFGNEITFIIPCFLKDDGDECRADDEVEFIKLLEQAERSYNNLVCLGWKPQEARVVLPNALKTEIVISANIREWRTIFKQRTSMAAHPQMRELMCPLLEDLKGLIPVVFDDINSSNFNI